MNERMTERVSDSGTDRHGWKVSGEQGVHRPRYLSMDYSVITEGKGTITVRNAADTPGHVPTLRIPDNGTTPGAL